MQAQFGWILLGGSIVVAIGLINVVSAEIAIEDGDITDDITDQIPPAHEIHQTTTPPCCTDDTFENTHYLIASTMDGKIRAFDVRRQGNVVWEQDFEEKPLMDGTLSRIQPMEADGRLFHLVPSLDGSLYMYSLDEKILEPIPLTTSALLQASVKIGHEVVAGGRVITTTGVDPMTGQIRYHCTADGCDRSDTGTAADSTIVFRRSSHTVRAMDALTGSERWNLSVSEYDAHLVVSSVHGHSSNAQNIRYLVRPPEGVVTAYDNCGNEVFSQNVGSHIAHLWELSGGALREVSLFETRNIHTLSLGDHISDEYNPYAASESMFYLGTCNNQPFIIHSPKMKDDSKKAINTQDWSAGRKERQLVTSGHASYFVEPNTLVGILTSTYKNTFVASQVTGENNSNNQVVAVGSREVQVVHKQEHPMRGSCSNSDAVSLIGNRDVVSAGFASSFVEEEEEFDIDQGYFVMRPQPTTSRRSFLGIRDSFGQCGKGFVNHMKRSFNVEEGWWRVISHLLLGVTGMVSILVLRYFLRPVSVQAPVEPAPFVEVPMVEETAAEIDEGFVPSTASNSDVSVEYPATKSTVLTCSSTPPSPAGELSRPRRTTGSNSSSEPFTSKFMTDFEVLRVLGMGGYGVVFEAENKLDLISYAVKRVAVHSSEHAIARVLREVRAMANLDHPGIIRYYHSWIETPPAGFQDGLDSELIIKLKARRRALREEGNVDSCDMESQSVLLNQPPPIGHSISTSDRGHAAMTPKKGSIGCGNPLVAVDDDIDELAPPMRDCEDEDSWADEVDSDGEEVDDNSSSDDSGPMIIHTPLKEESDSIAFEYSRSRQPSVKSISSQEVSVIDTPMCLMTSDNEELLPSKDVNENHSYVYIQMQLCQQRTLSHWLKKHSHAGDRPIGKMKNWFHQLVSAADYIHTKGLIHRDIKPQNIFFSNENVLKIGDMGLISKNVLLVDSGEPDNVNVNAHRSIHTGDVGTRRYMSPEQLDHRPYTSKVDVFSLGMIFCEMVIPFGTDMERGVTLSDLQQGRVPKVLDNHPEEKKFIAHLCSKDPENRPTCSEILDSEYFDVVAEENLARQRSLSRRYSVSRDM